MLVDLADEAVRTSAGLFNVGAADRPDLLAVEISVFESGAAATVAIAMTSRDLDHQRLTALTDRNHALLKNNPLDGAGAG